MAFPHTLLYALIFILFSTSPSQSLTCTSQNFTNSNLYKNCNDLPSLKSYLHWTYNASESSLHIAFLAPPAKSDGWVSWAINPTKTGMEGAQSLIAFKQSNGSMTVRTFSLNSYVSIVPSKLAFDVSNSRAEYSDGFMKIFATLWLPKNMTTVVNQVWQVGGSVGTGDVPAKHEFNGDNLNAKGKLELVGDSNGSGPITAAPAPAPSNNSDAGKNIVSIYVILGFIFGIICC